MSRVAGFIAGVVLVLLLISAPPASALVINGTFRTTGSYSGLRYSDPLFDNRTLYGGGNLAAVFDAAAQAWENEFLDDRTININFGWSRDLPLGNLGLASTRNDVFFGTRVDNRGGKWFIDPTPLLDEEFTGLEEFGTYDFGAGPMTYGHIVHAVNDNFYYDLLTVAVHEIGHVLSRGYLAMGDVQDHAMLTAPRPFAGSLIPIERDQGHLAIPDGYGYTAPRAVMSLGQNFSGRAFLSDIDVLAVAESAGFEQLARFQATAVPEPDMAALFVLAVLALGLRPRLERPPSDDQFYRRAGRRRVIEQ